MLFIAIAWNRNALNIGNLKKYKVKFAVKTLKRKKK